MPTLEHSPALQRRLRRDSVAQLHKRSEDWLIELIEARDDDQAVEVAGYLLEETQILAEHPIEVWFGLDTWIAEVLGEEKLHEILIEIGEIDKLQRQHMAKQHLSGKPIPPADFVRLHESEMKRTHRNIFSVSEEPERFKMVFNPCTHGRIRRLRDENGQPLRCAGRTKVAHPWSWNRADVPYMCCRTATVEQVSIEDRGYPFMVTECPEDDFAPCVRYLYKDPADIPEHYFERAGRKRDPSKFKHGV